MGFHGTGGDSRLGWVIRRKARTQVGKRWKRLGRHGISLQARESVDYEEEAFADSVMMLCIGVCIRFLITTAEAGRRNRVSKT